MSSLAGWLAAVECTLTSALLPLTATVLMDDLRVLRVAEAGLQRQLARDAARLERVFRLAASRLSQSFW